jgi:hypothetical protein
LITIIKNPSILKKKKSRGGGTGGVTQGVGPEFRPQYHKKKKSSLDHFDAYNRTESLKT